ncbi:MAG: YbaN family protein [Myxococcota bacterium]
MKRIGWLALGWVCFAIGVVGVVLPGIPTTVPMLFALGCFARGSDRVHRWLIEHPVFGPPLHRWQQHRSISIRAKVCAVLMIAASFGYITFWSSVPAWGVGVIGVMMLIGLIVVLRTPHDVAEESAA